MPAAALTPDGLVAERLTALLLSEPAERTPEDVVTWFGAMQAQDLGSGLWSMGARIAGATTEAMNEALRNGSVLRTWPMRGTIHLVPARDAAWMLATTGPRALRGVEKRWEQLALDRRTVERAAALLDEALTANGPLTRSQALTMWREAGIDTAGQRGYHLIWFASQTGISCLGPQDGSEQTLVGLADWVPDPVHRDHDDGLRELALRYTRSHGPISHTDLARWAGITATQARAALTANDDALELTADGQWRVRGATAAAVPDALVLPGFDEFILGYADRSPVLAAEFTQRICPGNNGVFRATLVLSGQVAGTWKRTARTRADIVTVEQFGELTPRRRRQAERAFEPYARFLGKEVDLRFE